MAVTKNDVEKLSKQGFEQVCIWPGVLVANDSPDVKTPEELSTLTREERIASFENWVKEEFDTRAKYLEEVKTNPDIDSTGKPIPETGDRNDLFFVVHKDDIGKFAIPRLKIGIRWYEDVVSYNNHAYLYPQEILDKYKVRW